MILAYIDQDRGKINQASFEALTLARRLAEQTNAPLHAVVIGNTDVGLTAQLGAFGVSALYHAQHEQLNEYAPAAYAQCLVEILDAQKPDAALAAGTERGRARTASTFPVFHPCPAA